MSARLTALAHLEDLLALPPDRRVTTEATADAIRTLDRMWFEGTTPEEDAAGAQRRAFWALGRMFAWRPSLVPGALGQAITGRALGWANEIAEGLNSDSMGADEIRRSLGTLENVLSVISPEHQAYVGLTWNLSLGYERMHSHSMRDEDRDLADRFAAGAIDAAGDLDTRAQMRLTTGTARWTRFGRTADPADLDRSITLMEEGLTALTGDRARVDPRRPLLAMALSTRFKLAHRPGDLARAIELLDDFRNGATAEHDLYVSAVSELSVALRDRYGASGDDADADRAAAVLTEALRAVPDRSPRRALLLTDLGNLHRVRFQRSGDPAHLAAAIDALSEACDAPAPDAPRHTALTGLGSALALRYRSSHDVRDLERAIASHESALELAPADGETRSSIAGNLSRAYRLRFERLGDVAALDRAVETLHREDTAHEQRNTPGRRVAAFEAERRAIFWASLAEALRERFERTGDSADLETAIAYVRRALSIGGIDRPRVLAILSLVLRARYELLDDPEDMNAAIDALAEAVSLDDGERSYWENSANLGALLLDRYGRLSVPTDLDQVVLTLSRIADRAEVGPDDRASVRSNLSTAYLLRHRRRPRLGDLDRALVHAEEALRLSSTTHPERGGFLYNLGMLLDERYEERADPADLAAAIAAYREAAFEPNARPMISCRAAIAWGQLTAPADAVRAYARALDLIPAIAPPSLRFADVVRRLQDFHRVGRDAAAAHLAIGDVEGALSAVEHGRAVTFARVSQRRADLQVLRRVDPAAADALQQAFEALDVGSRNAVGTTGSSTLPSSERRAAYARLEEALQTIRAIPRFHGFLLPESVDELRSAAVDGPVVVLNVARRRCDALIVETTGVSSVHLDIDEDEVDLRATQFLSAVDLLSGGVLSEQERTEAESVLREVMAWLWLRVAGPVIRRLGFDRSPAAAIDDLPRMWWVPTGAMSVLPLHAAGLHGEHVPVGRSGTARSSVLDVAVSSTMPTIGSITASRARGLPRPEQERVLVAAMPTTVGAPDLPHARLEAETIAQVLGADRVDVRGDFTGGMRPPGAAEILAALPDYAWVHLACHSRNDPESPTASALLFGDDPDDVLRVIDLIETRVAGSQFLFLSACTTARTGLRNLDEPQQFASAALLAGFRHVVATLWPIVDDPEPSHHIYAQLAADLPAGWAADGLARAVHASAVQQRRLHPSAISRWAALVHFGP